MSTALFTETFENFQKSTLFVPECLSYTKTRKWRYAKLSSKIYSKKGSSFSCHLLNIRSNSCNISAWPVSQMSADVWWLPLILRVKVSGNRLWRWDLSWFSSVLPDKCQNTALNRLLPVPSQSFIHHHNPFKLYVIYDVAKTLLNKRKDKDSHLPSRSYIIHVVDKASLQ